MGILVDAKELDKKIKDLKSGESLTVSPCIESFFIYNVFCIVISNCRYVGITVPQYIGNSPCLMYHEKLSIEDLNGFISDNDNVSIEAITTYEIEE